MEEENNMIEERKELMVSSINGEFPTLRKAHFLKPISNPTNQPHPDLSSLCLPLNPDFIKLLKKRVSFHGMSGPLKSSWKSWVDTLEQSHQQTWKKVGIFEAIKASTYNVVKDVELIIELAERWCSETNTFFFPWGESTITLEDVMILGGFSVLGSSARSHLRIIEDGDILNELTNARKNISKGNSFCVSQNNWMNYFRGKGGEIEHVAFVVLWLSRYVFTTNSYGRISSKVFSIAISLSRGTRIALGPAVLASLYSDLRLLSEKIVACKCNGQLDDAKLVVWAPFYLVQLWAWERFPALGLKPSSLASHGQPRVARWEKIKGLKRGVLRLNIEASTKDDFLWRPYALQLKHWELPKFYCDQEKWVLVKPELDDQLLSFAKCLRTCVLVGVDCMEQYLPQRVAMQFALDQDVPFSIPRSNAAASEVPWNSYDKPLDGLKFYSPSRSFEGGVTVQYSEWWRAMLSAHDECESWRRSTAKLKKVSKEGSSNSVGDISRKMQNHDSSSCKDITKGLQASPSEAADTCKENVEAKKEEIQMSQSNTNMGQGSRTSEGNHEHLLNDIHVSNEAISSEFVGSSIERRSIRNTESDNYIGIGLMDCQVNNMSSAPARGEQGGEREDGQSKQLNTSNEGIVIINDDEEDRDPCDAFNVKCFEIDSRISKLEKIVSVLQVAKLKSKVA